MIYDSMRLLTGIFVSFILGYFTLNYFVPMLETTFAGFLNPTLITAEVYNFIKNTAVWVFIGTPILLLVVFFARMFSREKEEVMYVSEAVMRPKVVFRRPWYYIYYRRMAEARRMYYERLKYRRKQLKEMEEKRQKAAEKLESYKKTIAQTVSEAGQKARKRIRDIIRRVMRKEEQETPAVPPRVYKKT